MSPELDGPFGALAPGEVAFCVHPSERSVVDLLPADAFENLLVLTTDADLDDLERAIRNRGGDPSHVGVLPITGTTVRYDGALWATDRVSPGDLTGVSIQFSEAFRHVKPGTGWVVVDNLGVLSMYVSPERLFRLVDSIATATRTRDVRCVLATTAGVLSEQSLRQFGSLADETVELD